MDCLIRLPTDIDKKIHRHLLERNEGREQACFVYAKSQRDEDAVVFEFLDWAPIRTEDFAAHCSDYLELSDEARARIIKKAHDLECSLIEFHCHPWPFPAQFSLSDRAGLEEFVPHVWWRLNHRPYAAIVVAPSSFDGLAWIDSPKTPIQLTGIVVGSESRKPTNLSLPNWRATAPRFDRNIRLFGRDGQEKLCRAHVAVVGGGGLGTQVIQQLAHLGVAEQAIFDDEVLDKTNPNRYIGVRHDDEIPGMRKVDLGERIVKSIDPQIRVVKVFDSLVSDAAFDAIKRADYVFGCLDNDGTRLILNELCQAYSLQYFDLASDIDPGPPVVYGGRVCISWNGDGCPVCLKALDMMSAQDDLASPEERANRKAVYGVDRKYLGEAGPSVVSINGVVASLAVTEFMVAVTGIRAPQRLFNYYGQHPVVRISNDKPSEDCYYCKGIRGRGKEAGVERHLKTHLRKKRSA